MRLIDADEVVNRLFGSFDMERAYLLMDFVEEVINKMPEVSEENWKIEAAMKEIQELKDSIPFNIEPISCKYRNMGQSDGLEQALDILEEYRRGRK